MADNKLKEITNEVQIAGVLKQEYIDLIGIDIPSTKIYIYPGAIKHIKKKHIEDFNKYFKFIPDIISNPDYVGKNPKEKDSIELIKYIDDNVLVAVKLDPSGYLYLSSMYSLTESKVPKRLKSGRIKKINL